jgi:cytochrome c-type biogenesis protein CcmH/NrfF
MGRRAPLVLGVAAGVVFAATLTAFAQPFQEVEAQAQQIFTSVMSPYCPGLLLADCPSPAAFELRLEIRKRLVAGESPDDIEQDLYDRYGDVLRAVPPPKRWGLLLWVAPALALAVSLAALTRFVTRRNGGAAATSGDLATDPAMAERLQRELDDVE